MRFHYIASQSNGKVVDGDVEAKNKKQVLAFLASKELKPISVSESGLEVDKVLRRSFRQKIGIKDKLFFTKYLGLMLKSGIDLFRAIDILVEDSEKRVMKAFLTEVKSALEKGQPFHTTFARYPKFFSPVFVNMIKAGESSGTLDVAFDDLNQSIEKENELRSKIRAALVYPMLLMIMATAILVFLVTFALPKIAEVFSGGGFNPPLFSRIVFSVGLFFNRNLISIIVLSFILIIVGGIFLFKTKSGKKFRTKFMSMLPVVRVLVKEIALQRFASTFSSLTRAGLPVVSALDITANAVGHADISASLQRIGHEGVIRGLTLGDAFKREAVFPKTVTNLVAISEKAGHLDDILKTLSEFYESEIDSSLKILISFLEPALLVVIGFVVALIALAIIVPIYQLVGQFS